MALMASNNSILQQPQNHTDFRLTRSNHEDKEADPASDWCLPLYKGRDVLGHPQHDSDQSAVESSWMVNHRTKGYCKDESGVSSVPYHLLWDFLVTTNPHAADRPRMAYRNSGHVMPTSVNFHKHIYRCCKCRGGSRRDRVPIYRRLMLSMVPSEHVLPVPIVYGPAGTRIALGDQRELISSTSPTPRLPYLRFLAGPHNPPRTCSSSIPVRHAISVLRVTVLVTPLTQLPVDTSFVLGTVLTSFLPPYRFATDPDVLSALPIHRCCPRILTSIDVCIR